jgi:hypothetical protein
MVVICAPLPTGLEALLVNVGALAVAVLGDREDELRRIPKMGIPQK